MKIPYKFKAISDEGKLNDIEFLFPTAWEDLTFEQGSRLLSEWYSNDKDNIFLLLSILTGVDPDVWENGVGNFERDVYKRLSFIDTPPDLDSLPFPEKMKIGDKEIELPKKVELETFGQKVLLQSQINKSFKKANDMMLVVPTALAVYAYPEYYGSHIDGKKLITFTELIKQANFLEVYSAGRFFFLRSLKLSK